MIIVFSSSWNLTSVMPFKLTLFSSVSSSSPNINAADFASFDSFYASIPNIPSSSGGVHPLEALGLKGTASFSTGSASLRTAPSPTIPAVAASIGSTTPVESFYL